MVEEFAIVTWSNAGELPCTKTIEPQLYPPYWNVTYDNRLAEEPALRETYDQFPAVGLVVADVNEIGLADVPTAISVPLTSKWFAPVTNLTMVPASTVSVAEAPTVTDPVRTQFIPCSQVSSAPIVPLRYPTALLPFPVAVTFVRLKRCVPGSAPTA
jgi:hypothetical protein